MTLQIIINRSLPTWKIAARLLILFVKEIRLLTIVDEPSGRKLYEYVHRDLSSPVQNKSCEEDVPEAGNNLLPAYFPIYDQLTFALFSCGRVSSVGICLCERVIGQ